MGCFLFARVRNLQMLPQIPAPVLRLEQARPDRPGGGGGLPPSVLGKRGRRTEVSGAPTLWPRARGRCCVFCWLQADLPMVPRGSGSRVYGPGGLAAHCPGSRRPVSVPSTPRAPAGLDPTWPAARACPHCVSVVSLRPCWRSGLVSTWEGKAAPCPATSGGGFLVLGQRPSWLAEAQPHSPGPWGPGPWGPSPWGPSPWGCPVLPSPQVSPSPASFHGPKMSVTLLALGELSLLDQVSSSPACRRGMGS